MLWKTLFKFNVLCCSKSVYPDPAFNLLILDPSEDLESFPFSLLSGSEEERRNRWGTWNLNLSETDQSRQSIRTADAPSVQLSWNIVPMK